MTLPVCAAHSMPGGPPMTTDPLAYYPGCLATETAREYDASIRKLFGLLDIAFEEIPDWNCCGAGLIEGPGAEGTRQCVWGEPAFGGLGWSHQ